MAKRFAEMPVAEFVDLAASGEPTPGGGGVAALAGALGAAMASMAANFTIGRPKCAEFEEKAKKTVDALAPVVSGLRDAVDADAEAFLSISAAYKLPKADDAGRAARKRAITDALVQSMAVPEKVLDLALEAAMLLPGLAEYANANLLSDVEVAAVMLEAAARAARINILVNASHLPDRERTAAGTSSAQTLGRVRRLAGDALAAVAARRTPGLYKERP
ncbi:MAG: cyclodeaminase/cyclohydrolase family protein [Planctomycetota bacterium]|jgi:formiminotetrahydrofolate cyclodeaminase|nr:cyclodeaminase/cyclohydrolase family protein [Planctomycetota bacterium]